MCWTCNGQVGTFIYVMWARTLVLPFWKEITKAIQEWLGAPVPESIQFLGDSSRLPTISKPAFVLALSGFISDARIILAIGKVKSDLKNESGLS